jgi:hypothetical protein
LQQIRTAAVKHRRGTQFFAAWAGERVILVPDCAA